MNLDGYIDVPSRLRAALAKHPDLRVLEQIPEIVTINERTFIQSTVQVYRDPDDPLPTAGTAWEPFPGQTPFTRNSEMMNAATSALGRALGYMGFGLDGSIASANEVRNRQEERVADIEARGHRINHNVSVPPAAPRKPSDRQLEVIARMAAERGLEEPQVATADEASQAIDRLKAMPTVR